MIESNTNFEKNSTKPRSKKLHPRIDLTAMVSVSFLLIVFFMVTIDLSKPRAMDLGLPDYGCSNIYEGPICCVDHRRQITLLLDDNDQIISYQGLLEVPEEKPKKLDYSKAGIRKELLDKKRIISQLTGDPDRSLIVIIKPSKKSNFGNLVSILDEMAITHIPTYAVLNDFTPGEAQLLATN